MAAKHRIIIDTDPGNDDVVAMLLALAAPASELEVVMISVVEGNIEVRACLRNVVAIFHILSQEVAWRKAHNIPVAYEGVTKHKPIVAIGADEPLHDKTDNADYFHGTDGLGGSTETHPEFNPDESWKRLFEAPATEYIDRSTGMSENIAEAADRDGTLKEDLFTNFTPSLEPAHKEILRLLRENEPDTISIVSIGPLTNLALAAAEDPETFLRCREVISMGGAIDAVGNVTPNAEFNVWADPHAAARIYALTSKMPASTMPASVETYAGKPLPPYPDTLSKQLKLILLSLDITERHVFTRSVFAHKTNDLAALGSPLARWMRAFLLPMLDKMAALHITAGVADGAEGASFTLHDPLCIYYILTRDEPGWTASPNSPEDIRVETLGQWTRGMTLLDRRPRRRRDSDGEAPHDRGNWLGARGGNRVVRMLGAPLGGNGGKSEEVGVWMLDRILGFAA